MKVQIEFTGLCCFVRDKPYGHGADKVDVILVDGTKSCCAAAHNARLAINLKGVDLFKTTAALHDVVSLPDGEQLGIWDLSHRQLDFLLARPDGVRMVERRKTRNGSWTTKKPDFFVPRSDASWLADLELACGKGKIRKGCLDPVPSDPLVAARVHLDEGDFEAGTEGDWEDVVWELDRRDGTPPYRQVIAERVLVRFSQPAPLTEIRLSNLARDPDPRVVMLRDAGRKPVQVQISNLPPVPPDSPVVHHFRAYYDLVDGMGPNDPRPIPTPEGAAPAAGGGTGSSSGDRGGRTVFCPPSQGYVPTSP